MRKCAIGAFRQIDDRPCRRGPACRIACHRPNCGNGLGRTQPGGSRHDLRADGANVRQQFLVAAALFPQPRVPLQRRLGAPAPHRRGLRCGGSDRFPARSYGQTSSASPTDVPAATTGKNAGCDRLFAWKPAECPRSPPPCSPESNATRWRGFWPHRIPPSSLSAAERSSDSALSLDSQTSSASSGMRVHPTPRFSALALRAESTSTRRVSCAAKRRSARDR